MKKALSLLLAVVMIVLLLPITMLPALADETETETTAAAIKYVKLFAKYGDEWDIHANYGSVAAITDGDPNPGCEKGSDDDEDRSDFTYYQSDDLYESITYYYLNGENKLELNSDDVDENKVYMGFAMFELNGVSAIDDVTIWLAGDTADEWKNPATSWNMNNEYDILVSDDGETWTVLKEFTEMCGDGTNAGANFPAEGDAARAVGTDGKLGHKIDLDGAEAKYFAIGVKHGMNSVKNGEERNAIVFGEVTVNGTVVTPDPAEKTPAEIYAEAEDGDKLYAINFHDTTWSDDYANSDNWNTYAYVSKDGTAVKHLIHGGKTFNANNKRAMWGGIAADERFSLDGGEKYTLYFDADFGSPVYHTYGVGIQVDGDNTLVIDGFGCSYWYNWNTNKVSKSDTMEDKWNNYIDDEKSDTHSFAVEVDSENDTMTLYIATADGTYAKVREMTYDDADISGSLICRIYTTRVNKDKTIDDDCWSEVSNIKIYKGLVGSIAPDASDDNETPDSGEGTAPDGGEGTTPDGGEGTTPDGGEGTTPDGGEDNTDNENTGNENTGNENTGNENTGNENTGNENTGNENTGNENTGNENTGNENTGNENNDNGNTDAKDEAPTTEAPKAEEETEAEKSGCGSTLAMSGVALVGACAAMLAIKRRKNEDD